MKYIFLAAMLMFNTFAFAQNSITINNSVEFPNAIPQKLLLEGMWESEGTSYICIITVNEFNNTVETIHNVSFEEDLILLENIVNQNKESVVTNLHNKLNGHEVTSTYTLVDDNTLKRVFKGDANETIYYTRNDKKLKYAKLN